MSAILRILTFTNTFWKWYVAAGFFVIVTSGLSLVVPLLNKEIVDEIVGQVTGQGSDVQFIIVLLGFVLLTQIVQIVLQSIGGWIGDIIQVKLQTYLSASFYKHLLSLHIGFYDNEVTGKTMNKMYRGIEQITGFVQSMINNFLPFLLTAIVTIALLAYYSWVIALLLAALFPIYILISHNSTVSWKKYQDEQNDLSDVSLSRAYESVAGIRLVKSFATEAMEFTNFHDFRQKIEKLAVRQTRGWHVYDFARQFVLNAILFAIFAYIVYHTFNGRYTIGEMTLLLQLVQQARFPLFAMSYILGQIQRAESGSKEFFSVIETPIAVNDATNAAPLVWKKPKSGQPLIEVKNLHFSYDADKPVLSDINFTIKPHERFALVGESGQGKSTLVNLLLRFYEPQQGKIAILGQDISQISQTSLRQQIAVVFQDSLLFSGSILDNIRYAKPEASMDDVIKAAKAANAHEFVSKLPDQYDSLVGERGVKLSGGQKQRISIARAILKDAPIIVLDEATSSLDSKSEVLVQEGLDRLMKGRTSIIIAHRLSTIANADHILVLANGTVAEYGDPKQLIKTTDSVYAKLVKLQQQLLESPSEVHQEELKKYELVEE
jgi:ATP-binding cassette, subfamily B, bacterial